MIQLGDLVRIKNSPNQPPRQPRYIGKLAIVVIKGTWSADVHVVGTGCERRYHLDNLEKL